MCNITPKCVLLAPKSDANHMHLSSFSNTLYRADTAPIYLVRPIIFTISDCVSLCYLQMLRPYKVELLSCTVHST